MSERSIPSQRPVVSRLHPSIYKAIVGFWLWFLFAIWGFAGSSHIGLLLAVITGFFLVAMGLPWLIFRNRRGGQAGYQGKAEAEQTTGLRSWSGKEFDTWTGRVQGKFAAVEALLLPAAAAVMMTAFAIMFHIAVHLH